MNNESEQDYHGHNAANYGEDEMASIVTHTQLPENCIVIDAKWLEEILESVNRVVANYENNKILKISEYYKYKGMQSLFKSILSNSYPLTPILEEVLQHGLAYMLEDGSVQEYAEEYLSQPITLKKK